MRKIWFRKPGCDGMAPAARPSSLLETGCVKPPVNLCLDHLKSARVKRESYVGPWLPEPVDGPSISATGLSAERLPYALMVTLERLNPLERAVFLLHEAFDFAYSEIGSFLELKTDHCRQLAHRARKHMAGDRARFKADHGAMARLLERFQRPYRAENWNRCWPCSKGTL